MTGCGCDADFWFWYLLGMPLAAGTVFALRRSGYLAWTVADEEGAGFGAYFLGTLAWPLSAVGMVIGTVVWSIHSHAPAKVTH